MVNQFFLVDGIPTVDLIEPSFLSDYVLIDVRREDEFFGELGHIEGARLVTMGPTLELFLQNTDKNQKLIFICRSGVRSASVTMYALNEGFKNVYNMAGGMIDWNNKKFPVIYE